MSAYDTAVIATSGIVHYWKCDETAGSGTIADSVGAQSGTVAAGVTLGVAGIFSGDTETLASFDGTTNAEITFTNEGVSHAANSIEFILKLVGDPTVTDYGFILMGCSGFLESVTILGVHAANGNLYGQRNFSFGSSTNSIEASAGNNLATATPYHIVLTNTGISGGTQLLYINGVQVQTRTGNWNTLTGINAIGFAGTLAAGPGNPVRPNGVIGKVAYYSSVISPTDITAHYNLLSPAVGGGARSQVVIC